MRYVELIAALKVLDNPEQSLYDKLKMVDILFDSLSRRHYFHSI